MMLRPSSCPCARPALASSFLLVLLPLHLTPSAPPSTPSAPSPYSCSAPPPPPPPCQLNRQSPSVPHSPLPTSPLDGETARNRHSHPHQPRQLLLRQQSQRYRVEHRFPVGAGLVETCANRPEGEGREGWGRRREGGQFESKSKRVRWRGEVGEGSR